MLKLDKLTFMYGEVVALRDVTMEIPAQNIVCVMGRNGVGKTTLMKNIVGVLEPSAGAINFLEKDVQAQPAHARARSGMAYVPQGRMIFPRLTVEENLRVGLAAREDGKKKLPEHIFEYFPILKEFLKRMGGDLSGGQQQQLAIARALVTDPKLLILDEPTEGIQPNIVQLIGEVLQTLVKKHNLTVLIVEQYLDFVRDYTDQFYVMNRGSVVEGGSTGDLSEEIVKQYLHV